MLLFLSTAFMEGGRLTLRVMVGSCLATAMRWPSRLLKPIFLKTWIANFILWVNE